MSADGYFYDDLTPGYRFESSPGVSITDGVAAQYVAITGDALPLSVDNELATAVTGSDRSLINPILAMHVSIGASTVATRNVIANLFYSNVVMGRALFVGDTLATTTRVAAMADSSKPGRGKVLLDIASSVGGEPVLEYQRCPLLPSRSKESMGFADPITAQPTSLDEFEAVAPLGWDLGPLGRSPTWDVGEARTDPLHDVVDNATALVRLTHNRAAVHRDASASPYERRLVYGGHPISMAHASLVRQHHGLASSLGWISCSHLGPTFEGDTLSFTHTLMGQREVAGGLLRDFQIEASVVDDHSRGVVLDWRVVIWAAPTH